MAIKHFDYFYYILVEKKEERKENIYLKYASTLTTAELISLISTSSVHGMKQVIGPLTVSLVSRS